MNLKNALLEEHSRAQCDRIVKYIGDDPAKFASLMCLFFEGEYRVTQRAAWPMSYCVRRHPELVVPYFKPLIDNLYRKNLHDAVIRNTLRLLQNVEIPKKFHGKLMSRCFEYLQSNEDPVAFKAFSISILDNLSHQYPEILAELKLIIEERWPHESAAFKSRGKKILNRKTK